MKATPRAFFEVFALLAALLACKSTGSTKPAPSASASASASESDGDESLGTFASTTTEEIEARSKKAGFSVKSKDESRANGILVFDLELENDDNFAYVTMVDLAIERGDSRLHAVKMTEQSGLIAHFEEAPKPITATKLIDDVVAKKPLAELNFENLKETITSLGWKLGDATSDSEDGVTTSTIDAEKGPASVTFVLIDFAAAKRDGRAAVDGNRFMNVYVCQDCTKRKEGTFKDIKHKSRAKKLLARLTKP